MITKIWDLFITRALSKNERMEGISLFGRLRQIYSDGTEASIPVGSGEAAGWIFELLKKIDPSAIDHLTFTCFQFYFCDINVRHVSIFFSFTCPRH